MEARIKDIINEAVLTNSISLITYQEREALGRIYKELTGENADILCSACLIKICNKIKNLGYGKSNKNKKSRRG